MFLCLSVGLFVSNLRKNVHTDLYEIFSKGWSWANKQLIKFRWWYTDHCLDTRIVFRIRHHWHIRKVVNG